jgi:hypothetical protein
VGLRDAGILYTILLILEMKLLEALGFDGEDYLSNGGNGSSSNRRVFRGNR